MPEPASSASDQRVVRALGVAIVVVTLGALFYFGWGLWRAERAPNADSLTSRRAQ